MGYRLLLISRLVYLRTRGGQHNWELGVARQTNPRPARMLTAAAQEIKWIGEPSIQDGLPSLPLLKGIENEGFGKSVSGNVFIERMDHGRKC